MSIKGSITLSALISIKMKKKGKSGKDVEGIFIPFAPNNIKLDKDGNAVYYNFRAFELKEAKPWATHMIKTSYNKDELAAMTEEQKKAMPIIGNLLVETYDGKTAPTPQSNMVDAPTADGFWSAESDEEMPF